MPSVVALDEFSLGLPGRSPVTAATESVTVNSAGSFVWTGRIEGSFGLNTLVVSESGVLGRPVIDGETYEFRELGAGFTAQMKIDLRQLPPDHQPDYELIMAQQLRNAASEASEAVWNFRASKMSGSDPEVDVVVLYSDQTNSNIANEVSLAEGWANNSFTNTEIGMTVDIVHYEDVDLYYEPEVKQDEAQKLRDGDIVVPDVDSIRTAHSADIVFLITDDDTGAKGVTVAIKTAAPHAFAIIQKDFFPTLTFIHEVTHVAGGMHDFTSMNDYYSGSYDPTNGEQNPSYAWAHGWVDTGEFKTVMAVSAANTSRVAWFSSPHIFWGFEPGDDLETAIPMGTENIEDVHRVWEERVSVVTDFEGSAEYLDPTVPNIPGLGVIVTGDEEVGWKETGSVSVSATNEPAGTNCTACEYHWYDRDVGATNWNSTEYEGTNYTFTMTWIEGHEFLAIVDDGTYMSSGAVTVAYCASGCGAKREFDSFSDETLPEKVELSDAYPNPFNPSTRIQFALPETNQVTLTIYNALGKIVTKLVQDEYAAGSHSVQWDAIGLESGTYFFVLKAGDLVTAKSVVLLK